MSITTLVLIIQGISEVPQGNAQLILLNRPILGKKSPSEVHLQHSHLIYPFQTLCSRSLLWKVGFPSNHSCFCSLICHPCEIVWGMVSHVIISIEMFPFQDPFESNVPNMPCVMMPSKVLVLTFLTPLRWANLQNSSEGWNPSWFSQVLRTRRAWPGEHVHIKNEDPDFEI